MNCLISKERVKLISCSLFHITWNTYPHILIKSRSQLWEASGRQNNIKARLVSSPLLLASLQKVNETKMFTVIPMSHCGEERTGILPVPQTLSNQLQPFLPGTQWKIKKERDNRDWMTGTCHQCSTKRAGKEAETPQSLRFDPNDQLCTETH